MPSAPRTAADHPQSLSWNAGAWFGSLFGCTLWMLLLAGLAFERDPASALVPSIAFALAAGLGGFLWSRRATLRAHTALQVQLAVTGLLALAAIASVDRQLDLATLEGAWGGRQAYAALLVYPVLMVAFWMRERAARRRG
jgi:hypothetical protein